MRLDELSKKKILKKFAADPTNVEYEYELFKRLESNEFNDTEIVEICMLLLEMREYGEW